MQLDLQSRPFTMTAALKHAVRTQLARLQARFGDWLHYARVRLEDVNGPRGGVDKRCRMVFGLPQMQPIVVQARSEDMYQAIHQASRRAEQALDRELNRRRLPAQMPRLAEPAA